MELNRKLLTISLLTIITLSCNSTDQAEPGILRVGFDIDDTVLFSYAIFANLPADKINPIDFGWVNSKDRELSVPITPSIELVQFYRAHGHEVFYITAREPQNGELLAEYLTDLLGYKIIVGENLFFSPKERIGDHRFTTKHRRMRQLRLDLYYGDSDTDMIAALKAKVHPVRVARHQLSIDQYGKNFFGNTNDGTTNAAPFSGGDLQQYYRGSVGIFGESIYPIQWEGPEAPNPFN